MTVNKAELVKRFGKGKAEAVIRECKEKNVSLLGFFVEIFNSYGAESLFYKLNDLCEKYDLPILEEEDYEEGYVLYDDEDDEYKAWKAFEYRLEATDED